MDSERAARSLLEPSFWSVHQCDAAVYYYCGDGEVFFRSFLRPLKTRPVNDTVRAVGTHVVPGNYTDLGLFYIRAGRSCIVLRAAPSIKPCCEFTGKFAACRTGLRRELKAPSERRATGKRAHTCPPMTNTARYPLLEGRHPWTTHRSPSRGQRQSDFRDLFFLHVSHEDQCGSRHNPQVCCRGRGSYPLSPSP